MAKIAESYIDGNGNKFTLNADEISVDIANNKSTVTVYLNINIVSGGSVKASGIKVGLTGTQEQDFGYREYYSTTTLAQATYDVTHNTDGSKTINVEGYFYSGLGNWDLSGSLTLTKINRYPTLTSGSNFTDRTNPIYAITAYGTYPIRVRLEAGGNTQLITRDLSSKKSQIYTLVLTKQERKTLKDLSPDGKTLAVRETVVAMNNGSEVSGSANSKDYTMTITSRPLKVKINGDYVDAIAYVRANNEWKEADAYIRVNNEWKEGI